MPSAYALVIVSGNSILDFGAAERLRAFRCSFSQAGSCWETAGAAPLSAKARGCGYSRQSPHKTKKPSLLHFCINDGFVLERPTRLELATSTLARWRSTR